MTLDHSFDPRAGSAISQGVAQSPDVSELQTLDGPDRGINGPVGVISGTVGGPNVALTFGQEGHGSPATRVQVNATIEISSDGRSSQHSVGTAEYGQIGQTPSGKGWELPYSIRDLPLDVPITVGAWDPLGGSLSLGQGGAFKPEGWPGVVVLTVAASRFSGADLVEDLPPAASF